MKYLKYFEMFDIEPGFEYSKIYNNEIREVEKNAGNDGGNYVYTGKCIYVSDEEEQELKNNNLFSYLNFFICYKVKDKEKVIKKLNYIRDIKKYNL